MALKLRNYKVLMVKCRVCGLYVYTPCLLGSGANVKVFRVNVNSNNLRSYVFTKRGLCVNGGLESAT